MTREDKTTLATLLGPLRRQEQAARQEFLGVQQRVAALEADLRTCQESLAQHDAWARKEVQEGRTEGLAFYRDRVAELGGELSAKRAELSTAREQAQEKRQRLEDLMKQKKAAEQALRRQQQQALARTLHKQSAAMDQVHAAQAAWRAGRGGEDALERPEQSV